MVAPAQEPDDKQLTQTLQDIADLLLKATRWYRKNKYGIARHFIFRDIVSDVRTCIIMHSWKLTARLVGWGMENCLSKR